MIAIHGDWGSGKTSAIMTIQKRLKLRGIKTVMFPAWKYEYTDPAAALVWVTVSEITEGKDGGRDARRNLARLALDIFARKTIDISLAEIERHFESSVSAINTLAEQLQQTVTKILGKDQKTVIFIDDLDRCSLENVIQMLEAIKLFLTIPNFIFVIAVDINKIKLAWSVKYGKAENLTLEGISYLEKIFQIQTGLPTPTREEIKQYVNSIDETIPETCAELLSVLNLRNPRSIKRLLNRIFLRSNIDGEKSYKTEAAAIWSSLEVLLGEGNAQTAYFLGGRSTGLLGWLKEISRLPEGQFENELTNRNEFYLLKPKEPPQGFNLRQLYDYCKISFQIVQSIDQEKLAKSLDEVVSFSRLQ